MSGVRSTNRLSSGYQRSAENNAYAFRSRLSLVRVTRGVCREQPTSTFKLLAFGRLYRFLECQRSFEVLPRAALRPRTEPCDSEKTWGGGADRDRTGGLRLAKPALSQLSYSPGVERVGQGRVELPTLRLSGVRSNHLSYWPRRRARDPADRCPGPSKLSPITSALGRFGPSE